MRKLPTVILVLGSLTLVACGSKDGGSTSGAASTTTSKPASTGAASAKTATKPTKERTKNVPKVKPDSAKKTEVVKRDASEASKPMPKGAAKLDDKIQKTVGEAAPKKAEDAPEGACKGIADFQAKCAGAKLLFCNEEEAFELDCDEDARMNGWVGGWCQEAAEEVNCVNYAHDPSAPPPEDEINCSYDELGNPYYCCTSITNLCWAPE